MRVTICNTVAVQCPICGAEYALPLDGDPTRRCPACGSPAIPAKCTRCGGAGEITGGKVVPYRRVCPNCGGSGRR